MLNYEFFDCPVEMISKFWVIQCRLPEQCEPIGCGSPDLCPANGAAVPGGLQAA